MEAIYCIKEPDKLIKANSDVSFDRTKHPEI